MRYIFLFVLFFSQFHQTWAQAVIGKVYYPVPIHAPALYLPKEGLAAINFFADSEYNFKKGFALQGAYNLKERLSIMGSFYRETDNLETFRSEIKQKMSIYETGIGTPVFKFISSDKTRIKLWDAAVGASWGHATDKRFFEKGSFDLPFHDGFTHLKARFHSYFLQVGYHYILATKIQMKFGGNFKIARAKLHYLQYRSNFRSQSLENLVIWSPQLSTDFRVGYQGWWLHFKINVPYSFSKGDETNYSTGNDGEYYLQFGIEKAFGKHQ